MTQRTPNSSLLQAQVHGWLVILFGLIGFLIWAATYPINQGITGSGFLIPKNERIQVITPTTGLVTKLAKHVGDDVDLGNVLLEFDSKPLEANIRSAEESIRGIEISNISLRAAHNARKAQVIALRTQYDSSEKLVEAGFASPSSLATFKTQLSLAESETFELMSRIEQNDYRLRELKERLTSMKHEMAQLTIYAPASGKIMNMAVKSSGVSFTAGSPLMEIVPNDTTLLIDARIPVEYSTLAHTGMAVDAMFPTLPGSSTMRVKGKLEYLAGDRITDPKTGQTYLEARISLDDQHQIESLKLRAGLPATVLLNTGPRTLLSYITRPLTERMARGLQ